MPRGRRLDTVPVVRVLLVVPLVAMAAVLLTGCSAPDRTSGSAVSSYPTLDSFKSASVSAGGTCRVWTEDDEIQAAAQSGTCGDRITLSTYLNTADLLGQVKLLRDTASSADDGSSDPPRTELLIGTNRLVSGSHVRQLQSKPGGQLAVINPVATG